MVVLVSGSREWMRSDEVALVEQTLDEIHHKTPIGCLIHGAARGVDTVAENWARRNQIPYLGVPAPWNELGKAAGMARNDAMINFWQPAIMENLGAKDLIVAFPRPNSKGTRGMIKLAQKYVVPLKVVELE